MKILDAKVVAESLPYDVLIDALDEAFAVGANTPIRAHHGVDVSGAAAGALLLMPCWQTDKSLGVKIATVFPDNTRRGLPAVHASFVLMSARTGVPLAVLDGTELTLRRTAAASALASRYLSRSDSKTLLMVGTGKLAPHMVAAHATVRDIERVFVWGRRPQAAHDVAERLVAAGFRARSVADLKKALGEADIVCCATLATEPLIRGQWLVQGQHLDLVGAFKPEAREADGEALARARVYVDTYAGALSEAGDILLAIKEGAIQEGDIAGDLAELVRGNCPGRPSDDAITLFKSVGTALEDLAAAEVVLKRRSA